MEPGPPQRVICEMRYTFGFGPVTPESTRSASASFSSMRDTTRSPRSFSPAAAAMRRTLSFTSSRFTGPFTTTTGIPMVSYSARSSCFV